MKIKFSDHCILPANISPYGSYLPVECLATITDENGKGDSYTIVFHRDPINGCIRSVKCVPKETTTEHTLAPEVVEDYCFDELNNL